MNIFLKFCFFIMFFIIFYSLFCFVFNSDNEDVLYKTDSYGNCYVKYGLSPYQVIPCDKSPFRKK